QFAQDDPTAWYFVNVKGPFYGLNYTIFSHLLPFIEQDNIYKLQNPKQNAGGQGDKVIKTYICPSDPSIEKGRSLVGGYQDQKTFAAASYGANYNVFGDGWSTMGPPWDWN